MKSLPSIVSRLIDLAIEEDLGPGDVTTRALGMEEYVAQGLIVAREPCVVCGQDVSAEVFSRIDGDIRFRSLVQEGSKVEEGDVIAELEGPGPSVLAGERTALNFLQRMCGVATLSRRFYDNASGRTIVVDSRKTIPGWRWLDKMAVRTGGCRNHRMGLFDGILIKDNHITACGGVAEAIGRAMINAPPGMPIEIEIDGLEDLEIALESGARHIMLDNFTPEDVGEAVERVSGRALVEISGGIDLGNLEDYLQTRGIDYISVGSLTHSARAVDISLDFR